MRDLSEIRKINRNTETYRIVRFAPEFDGGSPVEGMTGLTLAEAQLHCNLPSSHGKDWFDGYEVEA